MFMGIEMLNFRLPNLSTVTWSVMSNLAPISPFQGNGNVARTLDFIARELASAKLIDAG